MKDLQKKRLDYIDVMKGIGILLVCLGHSIADTSVPMNVFILSFHMPLFFFISGMLFSQNTAKIQFLKFLKKKSLTILLPQVICMCIGFAWRTLYYVILTKEMRLRDIISFDLIGWFLLALFFMEIIMYFAVRTKHIAVSLGVWALSLILFLSIPYIHNMTNTLFSNSVSDFVWKIIEQTFAAVFFGMLGMHTRVGIEKYRSFSCHGIGLFLYCSVAVFSMYNTPVEMYVNDYGNKFLFIFVAILGIMATIDLSILLEKSKLLVFFGQNSIIIYVFQFAITSLLVGAARKLLNWKSGTYPYYFIIFIAVVIVLLPIIWFVNKYLPFLFGKKLPRRQQE